MTDRESQIFRTFWVYMHDKELAGHFPYELLVEMDRAIHPVRCKECAGHNVQCAMMVSLNDRTIGEDFGSWSETDTKWCEDCEKHVQLVQEDDEPFVASNEVQFARLICVLEPCLEGGANLYEVAEDMGIESEELDQLFVQADEVRKAGIPEKEATDART